jgi:ABC-2 type transport system ATP-binding protein
MAVVPGPYPQCDGPPALRLTGLAKAFGDNSAVDGVDLTVSAGSFFGLVGPNGAGKTTALSMAVGLLRPDAGSSAVFGVDMWSDPVRAKTLIGVLPDNLALPERLTGRELLTFLGRLRGLDPVAIAERTRELLLGIFLLYQAIRLTIKSNRPAPARPSGRLSVPAGR